MAAESGAVGVPGGGLGAMIAVAIVLGVGLRAPHCRPLLLLRRLRSSTASPRRPSPERALSFVRTAAAGLSLLPDVVVSQAVDADAAERRRARAGAFFGARQVTS